MNIAILIPSLGGGGAERVAQRLGDYYFQKENNVYYFLMKTPMKQMYSVNGQIVEMEIRSCTESAGYGNLFVLFELLRSSWLVRQYKRKYQIDIAISFMEECSYMNVLSKGKEKVITRVCTTLSKRTDMKGILYNKSIVRFFYNLSDKIIVLSNYAKRDMIENYGIKDKKIYKIPNFIVKNSNEKVDSNWSYGRQTIICIGRLEPVKQQERIIRAFSHVKNNCKEAKLLILGFGSKKKYLENLCRKYNIDDSVYFIGFTEQINYYLQNSRAFVMASEAEGFPNSMVEAMANGVPVITTDCPGACGEIIGKEKNEYAIDRILYCKYGILTPYISGRVNVNEKLSKEEIHLGEALVEILSNDLLYEKYKRQSLKRANMYDIEKVIKRWDKLIESI